MKKFNSITTTIRFAQLKLDPNQGTWLSTPVMVLMEVIKQNEWRVPYQGNMKPGVLVLNPNTAARLSEELLEALQKINYEIQTDLNVPEGTYFYLANKTFVE